jgi:hypothetical protein
VFGTVDASYTKVSGAALCLHGSELNAARGSWAEDSACRGERSGYVTVRDVTETVGLTMEPSAQKLKWFFITYIYIYNIIHIICICICIYIYKFIVWNIGILVILVENVEICFWMSGWIWFETWYFHVFSGNTDWNLIGLGLNMGLAWQDDCKWSQRRLGITPDVGILNGAPSIFWDMNTLDSWWNMVFLWWSRSWELIGQERLILEDSNVWTPWE